MTRLEGRKAIVTGGANGQGRATALAFAREGAEVAAFDIDPNRLADLERDAKRMGYRVVPVPCDVTDPEAVEAAVDFAAEALGGVDVLFNNAGIYLRGRGDGLTHEMSLETWRTVFAVNADGMFLVAKYTIPHMLAAGRGSIINVSSIGGVLGSDCHAYSASKGAVLALTRSMALGYAGQGIRANAIAQAVIATNMSKALTENDPERAQRYLTSTPMGRWGESHEIAEVGVFLASDDSSYMTGATLNVDGGLSIRP